MPISCPGMSACAPLCTTAALSWRWHNVPICPLEFLPFVDWLPRKKRRSSLCIRAELIPQMCESRIDDSRFVNRFSLGSFHDSFAKKGEKELILDSRESELTQPYSAYRGQSEWVCGLHSAVSEWYFFLSLCLSYYFSNDRIIFVFWSLQNIRRYSNQFVWH